jgi:hypothetical protein
MIGDDLRNFIFRSLLHSVHLLPGIRDLNSQKKSKLSTPSPGVL